MGYVLEDRWGVIGPGVGSESFQVGDSFSPDFSGFVPPTYVSYTDTIPIDNIPTSSSFVHNYSSIIYTSSWSCSFHKSNLTNPITSKFFSPPGDSGNVPHTQESWFFYKVAFCRYFEGFVSEIHFQKIFRKQTPLILKIIQP